MCVLAHMIMVKTYYPHNLPFSSEMVTPKKDFFNITCMAASIGWPRVYNGHFSLLTLRDIMKIKE